MYQIEQLQAPPDRPQMTDLLTDYYLLTIDRLIAMGGPELTPDGAIAEFWEEIDSFLPPKGCLFLVRDEAERFIGTGSLRCLPGAKAEMKRLYVRPEARGTGLGRQLVELRMQAARKMGVKTLLADTFKASPQMLGLYESLGFRRIAPYPESATAQLLPDLVGYMEFLRFDFPDPA